jgi:hypothetical protein
MKKNGVRVRTWSEFRQTGLLLFVNSFLHIFGWSIACEYKSGSTPETSEPEKVYPIRTTWRGFDVESSEKAYEHITKYMKDNAGELFDEVFPGGA